MQLFHVVAVGTLLVCGLMFAQAQLAEPTQYASEQDYYNEYYRRYYQTQASDDTHFRDYYTELKPYEPSKYASQNYFNQPATPETEYNYYIVPSEQLAYSLGGTLDAQLPERHSNSI